MRECGLNFLRVLLEFSRFFRAVPEDHFFLVFETCVHHQRARFPKRLVVNQQFHHRKHADGGGNVVETGILRRRHKPRPQRAMSADKFALSLSK